MPTNRRLDYARVWSEAFSEGVDAGLSEQPVPMVVTSAYNKDFKDDSPVVREYVVQGGVCGFAWLEYKGNTRFAKWARDAGLSHNAYPTGHMISCPHFGQSMQRKEAWARAISKALLRNGIEVQVRSRMD